MRISEALKPLTDALAASGLSLDSVTYKDGKLHVTMDTAAKAAGKPGSGPEFPPEGYRLAHKWNPDKDGLPLLWLHGSDVWHKPTWASIAELMSHRSVLVFAVPIAPKPEPVKLTDQEKMIGWRGPSGFRLQTFQSRDVTCRLCKKPIKAGERLARWRHKFPEGQDLDQLCGKPGNEENHSHAHVDCLYRESLLDSRLFRSGQMNPNSYTLHLMEHNLSYHATDVPQWLLLKRKKFNEQNPTA